MQDNLEFINGVMSSWAVQGIIVVFLLVLLAVAFSRASRVFDDDHVRRVFRLAVVALTVLVVAQAALNVAAGHVAVPILFVVEFVWVFALGFYYFIRLLTGQRRGPGDDKSARRGAALDETISRLGRERRGP
ncbi:MAG: hypothetical protein IH629_06625 [Thermoleophilia bacterium]|nr:hypothetical protein [Thermoleophilia bacterium]